MIIHHGEPCISCEHYSADTSDENHWVCGFNHDTCPHIEALHKAVGYKERIDVDVLDKIREEFISLYPKNYAGELELGGASCVFSLHKVLSIIDKYKAKSEDIKND